MNITRDKPLTSTLQEIVNYSLKGLKLTESDLSELHNYARLNHKFLTTNKQFLKMREIQDALFGPVLVEAHANYKWLQSNPGQYHDAENISRSFFAYAITTNHFYTEILQRVGFSGSEEILDYIDQYCNNNLLSDLSNSLFKPPRRKSSKEGTTSP